MPRNFEIVTLVDGRRGYFYTTRFTGAYWFQPVDENNCILGGPEMPDESHEIAEPEPTPDGSVHDALYAAVAEAEGVTFPAARAALVHQGNTPSDYFWDAWDDAIYNACKKFREVAGREGVEAK